MTNAPLRSPRERIRGADRLRLERLNWPPVMNVERAHVPPELVDRLIELYCDWRTDCEHVRCAYERFSHSAGDDRALAFSAYTVALDREGRTCDSYAAQVRLVQARIDESTAARAARDWRSRLSGVIGRLASVWAELDFAQKRIVELRTGVSVLSTRQRRRPSAGVAKLEALRAPEDPRAVG